MGTVRPSLVDTMIAEEIRRLVAEAAAEGTLISTAATAAKVREIYPSCALSEKAIADRVLIAATAVGAPVEIERMRRTQRSRPAQSPLQAVRTLPGS